MSAARPSGGPVAPVAAKAAVLRPPRGGPFAFSGGFWGERQQVNAEAGIPHGLDEVRRGGRWDDLRHAAAGVGQVRTDRPDGDADLYKMAEAVAWSAESAGGRQTVAVQAFLRAVTNLVAGAQEPGGYLNSWFQCTGTRHFTDLAMGHEMFCAGHLIQAAVAVARTVGDTGLVAAAVAFADHLADTFGDGGRPGICGHPEIEMALVELYRLTGHDRYLDLAARMIDQRGHGLLGEGAYGASYYQDGVPVRDAVELDGHCVRALYLAAGATDVYLETAEPELLEALVRQWEHTAATKTYLTGGVGCRRRTEGFGAPYELPPDHAFSETCAAVASVMWSWRLLLATGEARYADHIERIMFNVLAAGVSLSGDRFSYVNPLQRRESAYESGDKAPFRKPWFDSACCPPNLMRLIASLGHYVLTTDAGGIQLHQYAAGSVRAELDDGAVFAVAVVTDYPWSPVITIDVVEAPDRETELSLRIPAWCRAATVRVDDEPARPARPDDGRLVLRRRWRPGSRVVLDLAMPPRLTWPDQRIDAVRGCVAIERGPLVYCLEDADLPESVVLDEIGVRAGWPLRAVPRPDLLGGIVAVEALVTCRPGEPPPWPYGSQGRAGEAVSRRTSVSAVPYYAWDNRTRGRMRVWLPVR